MPRLSQLHHGIKGDLRPTHPSLFFSPASLFPISPALLILQTPWNSTPGTSGTQWSEDIFRGKQPKFHLISTFNSSELTVPPFVEPSQANEPPIPGPSPSSKPHEDVPAREPEPEEAPTQSMEEPFAHPTPPCSVIIINDTPIRSLPPSTPKNPGAKFPAVPK
ncbi:hypothetical protein O181_029827 [Austropuccinia psidii MF-1]|uniref:Uncharacterized protein n=1 Tax=Austropuccinia psidii MF-1 TaxID=1389203 RepID=A0A9Q3CXC9_9BASI|nr:hypothetical protein [Austropuccinia psidii MF-1]